MSVKAAQQTEFEARLNRLFRGALDDAARREYVTQHPANNWPEVVATLTDRVREEVRVDTARADQLADLAVAVAETIGKPITLAKSLRAKANALYALDQHAAAIDLHRRAAAIFEQEGDEEELARTLSGSIQPLLLLGHYDQALAAADRALGELFATPGQHLSAGTARH